MSAPYALPPLTEQHQIVFTLQKHFETLEKIQQSLNSDFDMISKLNQSILAKAFRGELVEQDPNDEPASVLLDRIRAEREKLQGNKKSGSARGKRKKATDNQLDLPGVN